ncbi:MAG: dephospho-CoA kinase [Mycobacteriales bacterium]
MRVGLTGGIGAGKSAVASRLAALGALVIDADFIAREVLAPGTPGLARVVAAFGPGVCRPDGSLDREALGRVVFADPDARHILEEITHPLIGARLAHQLAAAPPGAIVIHDVPLLVEKGLAAAYDAVIVVEAPEEVRVERLVRLRGMSPEDARARVAAQTSDAHRRSIATFIIENDGGLDALDRLVGEIWSKLVADGGGPETVAPGA